MRNQKGITLVALVVTIVVLLILAGVSIAMLSGDNGIITNAKNAALANTEGEVIDRMNLAFSTVKAEIMAKSAVDDEYDATKKLDAFVTSINTDLGTESGITAKKGETANTIVMTYEDGDFGEGGDHNAIVGTITLDVDDASYAMPTRQINVEKGE